MDEGLLITGAVLTLILLAFSWHAKETLLEYMEKPIKGGDYDTKSKYCGKLPIR